MIKKAIAMIECLVLLSQSLPINAQATETTIPGKEDTVLSDSIDPSTAAIVNIKTVNDILAQAKFSARQGHGFAAERGNNLVDKIKGKNTIVVGDNNVKNGPDRLILNRDGTIKFSIQDKYYRSATESINACFDETGMFRYYDGDGRPMLIEVPSDQYEKAVSCMQDKIEAGLIDGVTDPQEAKTLVKKGNLTYAQAKNLAKAGTLESLTYDAANGAVTAGCAFGISTLINYSIHRFNGTEREDAIKMAAEDGLKTGGLVFCSSVIASQLSKTGAANIFKPSSEALAKALGEDFAKALIKASGEKVIVASEEATVKTVTDQAAKVIRGQAIAAVVTIVVFSVPDAIDLFNGRISQKQFVKNFAVTAVSVVGGTAGAIGGGALSNFLIPGVGSVPGAIVGGIVGGAASGWAADMIADYITDDDADESYKRIEEAFAQNCNDYLVSEEEAQHIVDQFSKMLDDSMYKDIYQNRGNDKYIDGILIPLFEAEVKKREKIVAPTEEEMRQQLKEELKEVAFIH